MNDIMEIGKSLEESVIFFIKDNSKTIKNEAKEQKEEFVGMLLSTLRANVLGNLLTSKDTIRAGEGAIIASEGTIRPGQDF